MGGVNRAPQNWGGGGPGKRAQLTGPLISYYELWRRRRPKNLKMVKFFQPNTRQMMILNPLDALIPKIHFSFFAGFWVWVTSEAGGGSVSVGFWGSHQLSPFFLGGGSSQGALSTPPPPIESPPSQGGIFPLNPDFVARNNEIHGRENWFGPLLLHKF